MYKRIAREEVVLRVKKIVSGRYKIDSCRIDCALSDLAAGSNHELFSLFQAEETFAVYDDGGEAEKMRVVDVAFQAMCKINIFRFPKDLESEILLQLMLEVLRSNQRLASYFAAYSSDCVFRSWERFVGHSLFAQARSFDMVLEFLGIISISEELKATLKNTIASMYFFKMQLNNQLSRPHMTNRHPLISDQSEMLNVAVLLMILEAAKALFFWALGVEVNHMLPERHLALTHFGQITLREML